MKNVLIVFVALFFSCTKNSDSETSEGADQSTAYELTYPQMEEMVFTGMDAGERIEWHGTELTTEAAEFVQIASGGECKTDCGKGIQITNTSDRHVETVVKAAFSIGDRNSYIARLYRLDPGETVSGGCSHLCLKEESYAFERSVVGAEFK